MDGATSPAFIVSKTLFSLWSVGTYVFWIEDDHDMCGLQWVHHRD